MKTKRTNVKKSKKPISTKILTIHQKKNVEKEYKKLIKKGKDVEVIGHIRHVTKRGSDTYRSLKTFEEINDNLNGIYKRSGVDNLTQNLSKKLIKNIERLFDL